MLALDDGGRGCSPAAGGPRLGDDACYVKAEHLQKTGSFKARGMTNRIAHARRRPSARAGVITVSAGQRRRRPTRGPAARRACR